MADYRRIAVVEWYFLFLLFHSSFSQLVSDSDRAALFDLRSSLGLRSRDWPRKAEPCSAWVGVTCREDGRVVGINVSGLLRTRLGRLNPRFSVDSLSNFTSLTSFNASHFLLRGPIPNWFGLRLRSLQVLDLSTCSVTGDIPSSLGGLSNLVILDLSRNSLTGSIPLSLSSINNLTILDLSSNSLTGSIPPSLATLSNLQILDLSKNMLSGSIPVHLGDLSQLLDIDLSSNFLTGTLPLDLRGLRSLRRMVFGKNNLAGVLPDSLFSGLFRLQHIILSHNNFTGSVPDAIWMIPELVFLDISYNNLTGNLPNLSSNVDFTSAVLNLSNNQFFGGLAFPLGRFRFVDLSNNYFQGQILDRTRRNSSLVWNCLQNVSIQKTLEACKLFYSGRGLEFDNFGVPNTTQPTGSDTTRTSNRNLTYILAGVLGGLGFIVLSVLALVFCLRKCRRNIGEQRGTDTGPVPARGGNLGFAGGPINFSGLGEAYSYEQILQATGDFNDSNLIKNGHSGDLFQGVLGDGVTVVIKRIDVSSKKDSYMGELNIFSKVSHNRLVPLLGHCLEQENEKFLVYKYMPNGDLSNSLYRKIKQEDENVQSLDWITRLKIAIGAADGLSYLHHECSPPIVHRDVQSSSILLDDKFEVRLGSLSEASIQDGDSHPNVITRLLRLPQTSEQGHSGLSTSTCAYDVHCFGKVLLELITGKLGMSKSDDATVNEWLEHTLPYISIYEKELVMRIVDPSLIIDEDLLEEVWAMAIVAKSCLNPKLSKRPLMKYVLKALENPLKVVREESSSSRRLRATSSRRSWNASIFGSWRHSSSDIAALPGNREGANSRQSAAIFFQGEHSSSNKRPSNDIYPEDMLEIERREEGS